MPGPCSAPNGNSLLVGRHPADCGVQVTGKTAVKSGKITHVRKNDRKRPTRAEYERMTDDRS